LIVFRQGADLGNAEPAKPSKIAELMGKLGGGNAPAPSKTQLANSMKAIMEAKSNPNPVKKWDSVQQQKLNQQALAISKQEQESATKKAEEDRFKLADDQKKEQEAKIKL
jgi:hypothetical protein